MSIDEVNRYLPTYEEQKCWATEYAKKNGAYGAYVFDSDGSSEWWLRSPGANSYYAAATFGYLNMYGENVGYSRSVVRPAFWLNL